MSATSTRTSGRAIGRVLRDAISIVRVGESAYLRRSAEPVTGMITEVVRAAVQDAGLDIDEVDGIGTDSTNGPLVLPTDELADRVFHVQMSTGGAGLVGPRCWPPRPSHRAWPARWSATTVWTGAPAPAALTSFTAPTHTRRTRRCRSASTASRSTWPR